MAQIFTLKKFLILLIASSLILLCLLQFRSVTIIAEGIPENKTKKLIKKADALGVTIIGPATVITSSIDIYTVLGF